MKSEVWVKISENTFRDAKFEDIAFILQILSWYPNNSMEKACFFIDSIDYEESENFTKLSKVQQGLVVNRTNDAFTNGKNTHPKYIITSKRTKQDNEFSVEEAIRFFLTPVFIVLENSLNDSYFLKAIFKHFGEKREDKNVLLEFLHNDWIQFVNAGGWTNIENFIEGRINSLEKFASSNNRKVDIYLRCFVLVDSDRLFPNDIESVKDKEELKVRLENKGIKVYILQKRAMENYMPNEVIENLISIIVIRQKQLKLSEKQEDKKLYQAFRGWLNDPPQAWINEYKHSISKENKNYLDYQTELNFPRFKTEFPKLFQYNNHVVKATLLAREGGTDDDNEFLEILQKIYELL